MKITQLTNAAAAVLFFAATAAFAANTWYVSPDGDNAAAGTEAAPFRTIQYAVTSAAAEDTIILLPGDYGAEQGTTNTTVSSYTSANRVVIDKPLTVIGRDGRDKTRIVGAWDTAEYAALPWGFGPNAVRCVWISNTASGTRLEGITFQDGSVPIWDTQGNDIGGGGGVVVYSANTAATIVDCAVVNCQGFNGGGVCSTKENGASVKVVRTLFKRCRGSKFGQALRGGGAYNCVFDDNGYTCFKDGTAKIDTSNAEKAGAFSYGYTAINCTFVNNVSYGTGGNGTFAGGVYNCLFQSNGKSAGINASYCKTTGSNVASTAALYTKFEVVSPFDGDYRLAYNADALDAGDATKVSIIPEGFRDKDYYGNPLPASGTIHAGAVQDALASAASGITVTPSTYGSWLFDGEPVQMINRTWRSAEGWPVAFNVKFVPVEGRALVNYSMGNAPYWPLPDDSIYVTARRNQVQGVNLVTTSNIFYADPVNGSDETGDGSEENPFKTLNKAVKKTTVSFVVRALPGDYNEGGENYGGMTNRVVVPQTLAGNLRVVAVGGPENTFITGASATSGDTANGTGPDAIRCIAVASTNDYKAVFQGFTIRSGRTDGATTAEAGAKTYGAALFNVDQNNLANSFNTAFLLDCVVSNCGGRRGGCIAGGNAYRCRFSSCASYNGGGGVLRYCNVVSSSFTSCGGSSQVFGPNAKGYNCTIWGSSYDSVYNGTYGTGYIYNCVTGGRSGTYADINADASDANVKNTLYSRLAAASTATISTAVKEDPLKLLGGASGDYRLAPDSVGLWLASTDHFQSCMDIDGNPFLFDTETGRYQAGCYATIRGGVYYADAENGSDSNDGLTEAAAFKTLAAAMAAADYMDTVIALPGTYDEGSMLQSLAQSGGSVEPTLPSRVVVKGGVTLESRDGAAATAIVGATSDDASAVKGCGPGAMRAVFLCKGATLRGFTVTGGATLYSAENTMTVNDYGGGVAGYYGAQATAEEHSALAENCIITANVACRGGGAMFGRFRNCRFTDNDLSSNRPGFAVARADLEGCYFSGNGAAGSHSAIYACNVVNCTVRGGQAGAGAATGVVSIENYYVDFCKVANTVILGANYKAKIVRNCRVAGNSVNTFGDDVDVSGLETITHHADGVLQEGSNAIDAGDASFCSAEFLAGRDIAGTRRVLNSTIDIGAYEYDWGVPWGAALGGKRLAVDDMPSDASLGQDGKSLVFGAPAAGEAGVPVKMTWKSNGSGAVYDFSARVTGSGTLTVTANGLPVGIVTSADGEKPLKFSSALASNTLVFSYDGLEPDGVTLCGFSNQAPFVLVVR